MHLEGFPGAPIEPDLFPLKPGMRWVFEAKDGRKLELAFRGTVGHLQMVGSKEGVAEIREKDGFIEILHGGKVIDRPFKLQGKAGDSWRLDKARYTVFGYDRLTVLGEERRTLVVAVEHGEIRDLHWFAKGIGWVRIRTEHQGAVHRDAVLVEFDDGTN